MVPFVQLGWDTLMYKEANMAKVLVLEDDVVLQAVFKEHLEITKHEHLKALCVADARAFFKKHGDEIAVMIVDGFMAVGDPERTTLQFIRDMRVLGYKGPMIAASSDSTMASRQREAGCDFWIDRNKSEAIQIALRLARRKESEAA